MYVYLCVYMYVYIYIYTFISLNLAQIIYGKTCLKRKLKGPEHFSAKDRFSFNQGTLHIKIKPGHARI